MADIIIKTEHVVIFKFDEIVSEFMNTLYTTILYEKRIGDFLTKQFWVTE